jgi:dephospho-CoA kinase
MPTLGITGSFGTGKSTVARLFARKGMKVIDADKIAHQVIKKGSREYKKIINLFGRCVLDKGGQINRKKLSQAVFGKRGRLSRLCKIIHPAVINDIKGAIKKAGRRPVAVDAPLLIEAGLTGIVDKIIVVSASRMNQIKRIKQKTNLCRKDILQRIKAQLPLAQKKRLADFIVDNDGSLTYTKRQVDKIWQTIAKKQ